MGSTTWERARNDVHEFWPLPDLYSMRCLHSLFRTHHPIVFYSWWSVPVALIRTGTICIENYISSSEILHKNWFPLLTPCFLCCFCYNFVSKSMSFQCFLCYFWSTFLSKSVLFPMFPFLFRYNFLSKAMPFTMVPLLLLLYISI